MGFSTQTKRWAEGISLGQEDPLEKGMATLPGESHGQSSLVGYSP